MKRNTLTEWNEKEWQCIKYTRFFPFLSNYTYENWDKQHNKCVQSGKYLCAHKEISLNKKKFFFFCLYACAYECHKLKMYTINFKMKMKRRKNKGNF